MTDGISGVRPVAQVSQGVTPTVKIIANNLNNAIRNNNSDVALQIIRRQPDNSIVMRESLANWLNSHKNKAFDIGNKCDMAMLQWLMGLRGNEVSGKLDDKTKKLILAMGKELGVKDKDTKTEKASIIGAGVLITGGLAADDATVVGVVDDPLIPVVWLGVAISCVIIGNNEDNRAAIADSIGSIYKFASDSLELLNRARQQARQNGERASLDDKGGGRHQTRIKVEDKNGKVRYSDPFNWHNHLGTGLIQKILKSLFGNGGGGPTPA